MSISVTCRCGHAFRVKDKYAGSKGKCPGCGTMVRVPGGAVSTEQAEAKPAHKSGSFERRLARAIGKPLHPKSLPEIPGLDAAGMCLPGRETGHDYFDCLQLHDGAWAVLIGTVNARGLDIVHSALELRAATHALALGYSDPGAILTLLNRVFAADWPEERSATLLLCRYDPVSQLLCYASAGHATAYVLDRLGGMKWSLESTDCPLGLLVTTMYGASAPLRLESGEMLTMFSDGLLKAVSTEGSSSVASSRLLERLASNIHLPAREMVERIQQLLTTSKPTSSHSRDRSLLALKVK